MESEPPTSPTVVVVGERELASIQRDLVHMRVSVSDLQTRMGRIEHRPSMWSVSMVTFVAGASGALLFWACT